MMSDKMKKMLMMAMNKKKKKKKKTVVKKDGKQPVALMKKGGAAKKKVKNAKLAAMYGDPNKITRGDIITAAKRKGMKKPKRRA
jgi:hypothetical protein